MDKTLSRWSLVLGAITIPMMVWNLYNIFIFVPTEQSMGIVQRIFYFHVPSAWVAFLAYALCFVFSILYLWKRESWHDRIAYCSAEVGVLFTTVVLLTGPIWARPVWNTWWSWDPRLTTTLILWFIYVAYMMLRNYATDEQRGARFAAVFSIVGFLDVPIVYFSIRWWRTIHPKPVILGGAGSGLHPDMRYTLMFSAVTFLCLMGFLLIQRLRLEKARAELNHLKRELAY